MIRSRKKRVCVLGAGVIGMSTALRILEGRTQESGGVEVTVLADRFSPNTTSDGSGGFWEPFNLGNTPLDSVRKWSAATWDHLLHLATSAELAGTVQAQFLSGYTFNIKETPLDWEFKDLVFGYRSLTPKELQICPQARSGSFFTSLQVTVRAYLPWLMEQFRKAGGHTERKTVHDLSQVAEEYDVVVNCCGPRAGVLVSDPETTPIRGQVRRIHAPWIKHFYLFDVSESNSITYILPQEGGIVVVGGIAQRGNWKEDVDDDDSSDIWKRAVSLVPAIKSGRKVSEWAGIRPGRTSVRLETETRSVKGKSIQIVHNYGHGGAGVTLHWGCAGEAAELVQRALDLLPQQSKL